MEAKIGDNGFNYDVEIRFGVEPSVKDSWKKIIEIDDKTKRDEVVSELIKIMTENKSENGFFGKDDEIIVRLGSEFVVDDDNIYYLFFDNLKRNIAEKQGNQSDANVIANTIKQTLIQYFGGFGKDKDFRSKFLSTKFDENDKPIKNSIVNLKDTGAAECAEYASLSHNLWLMTGHKSHYLSCLKSELATESSAHAFTIVELDENRTILYDIVQSRLSIIDKDAIKKILNNEGLTVGDNKYVIPSSAPIFE